MDFINDVLPHISNLIAVSALVPLGLFVFFYGTEQEAAPSKRRFFSTRIWRSTAIGKTVMYQKIAWICYLLFVAASLYFPDFWGREIVRFVIYSSLVWLFWQVFIVLRNVQKKATTPTEPVQLPEVAETAADEPTRKV